MNARPHHARRRSPPGRRPPRRGRPATGALATVGLLIAALVACEPSSTEPREQEVLLVVSSLTGTWSTLGVNSQPVMELAKEDVNRHLTHNAALVRFAAAIEDTRLEPDRALEKARSLRARGARVVIGPQSSAEVAHLKPYVDANGLHLVSHASTAGSLAIPGDNILRFTPSYGPEGVAVPALMWRMASARSSRSGGTTPAMPAPRRRPVPHSRTWAGRCSRGWSTAPSNPTSPPRSRRCVRRWTRRSAGRAPSGWRCIWPPSTRWWIFARAATDPVLGSPRWYGSDGVALSDALLAVCRRPTSRCASATRTRSAASRRARANSGAAGRVHPCAHEPGPGRLCARRLQCGLVTAVAYVTTGPAPGIDALKQPFGEAAA